MATPFKIRPARMHGQTFFPVQSMKNKAAESFVEGAAVVVDTNGELTECGANPSLIKGFAINKAFSGPGQSLADSADIVATVPPSGEPYDHSQVALAKQNTIFSGQMFSSTTLVTPTQTMIGESYGITKDGTSGNWYVDQTKSASNQRVDIVDIDTDLLLVFFSVIPANIQP